MKVLYLLPTIVDKMAIMDIFEYLTGKGGIMVLGLIVLIIFIIRKWKEKRSELFHKLLALV